MYAKKLMQEWNRVLIFIGVPVISFLATAMLLRMMPLVSTPSLHVRTISKVEQPTVPAIKPPVRIEIKSIAMSSTVRPVGITKNGDMAIPDSIREVGWYKSGPVPGEKGSAVIAGHYGWSNGQAAIFNRLHTLKKGARVSVYDQKNKRTSFIVKEIKRYNPEGDASGVFQSNDGTARLNLITCDGLWNNNLQTYSKRLVVFTDREI